MKNLILLLLISTTLWAQKSTRIAYEFTDHWGIVLESYLIINEKKESLFYRIDTREGGKLLQNSIGYSYVMSNDSWSSFFYRSRNQKISRIPSKLYGQYIYQTPPSKITYSKEQKKIGRFNCQKAIIQKGGRTYEAWFDASLPFEDGPWGLHGLPGLIIEAQIVGLKQSVVLKSIEKGDFSETLEKHKTYISAQKILDEKTYNEIVYKVILDLKRTFLGKTAKINNNSTGTTAGFHGGSDFFTRSILDIPENIHAELDKIH